MLQIMKDLPAHVVGVRAIGKVTEDDYKRILLPAVEKASKEIGEINFLMVLETDLGDFTYGAWMQDAKMSLKNFAKWNKIAIVSDQKVVERLAPVFKYISPAEARGFLLSNVELAKGWVAATDEAKFSAKSYNY